MTRTDQTADKKGEIRPSTDQYIDLEDKIADEKDDELIYEPTIENRPEDL
jgi:hypothetical protein